MFDASEVHSCPCGQREGIGTEGNEVNEEDSEVWKVLDAV
jgi:hypothetical protein